MVTKAGPYPHPSLSYLYSLKCGQWPGSFPTLVMVAGLLSCVEVLVCAAVC